MLNRTKNNQIEQNRKEHIPVCITTYKPNSLLRKLLTSLLFLKIKILFFYSIIVVDNDKNDPGCALHFSMDSYHV